MGIHAKGGSALLLIFSIDLAAAMASGRPKKTRPKRGGLQQWPVQIDPNQLTEPGYQRRRRWRLWVVTLNAPTKAERAGYRHDEELVTYFFPRQPRGPVVRAWVLAGSGITFCAGLDP